MKKSDWLRCLKTFYSFCRIRSKQDHLIERLRSDYGLELQSHKADKWLQKKEIVFEPLAPYFQEQNGVSERIGRTIMDMTRATILEGNIDDELWPEIVLAMTYIKNNCPTKALPSNATPYEAQGQENTIDVSHLRVLGSTVYVFLYKEERSQKSEKWAPRALKGTLVGYDGHTIYRVHIKDQNKVIRVKDLGIFKDFETKPFTNLLDYKDKPTFEGFLLADGEGSDDGTTFSRPKGQKVASSQLGQKVDHAENAMNPTAVPSLAGQTGHDTGSTKHNTTQLDREVENTEIAKERTSRSGRIVKPTAKAKDAIASSSSSSRIQGTSPSPETLPMLDPSLEVDNLIIQMTELLDSWDSCEGLSAMPTPPNDETDPIRIFVTKIHSANAPDQDHYVCSTQFDIEKPETYARAMQGPNAPQWAQAMEEELDQLNKNET